MSVTFAEARAACVARLGEPTRSTRYDGSSGHSPLSVDHWRHEACGVDLESLDGAIELRVWVRGARLPAWAAWPLTGPDATPLPDALDAAAAWLSTR